LCFPEASGDAMKVGEGFRRDPETREGEEKASASVARKNEGGREDSFVRKRETRRAKGGEQIERQGKRKSKGDCRHGGEKNSAKGMGSVGKVDRSAYTAEEEKVTF